MGAEGPRGRHAIIVVGPPGPQGPQGVGAQGPRGRDGISIVGPPGPQGARGTDGEGSEHPGTPRDQRTLWAKGCTGAARQGNQRHGPIGVQGPKGADGRDGRKAVSIQGPPGVQGPEGRTGPAGQKGIVIAGMGLNSVDVHNNQFVQHKTTSVRRPVIIIEQPQYVFQRFR